MPEAREAAARVLACPFFLDAPGGRLFAVHHRPRDASALRGNVLVVQAFNEEMNRCRSMVTLQAASLARLGLGTLVVDLHGTGDSAGEHGDARWVTWRDDLRTAHAWLDRQSGGCRAMLGIRLGALLAAQLHAELARPEIALVLWQPVIEGKTHLTQFLRVRMAAQLDRPDLPKESTASMRQQLESGSPVEVAGYELHPRLAEAIDALRLADLVPAASSEVIWLENVGGDEAQISLPGKKVLETWSAAGVASQAVTYAGAPFWQVHERVLTPSIVEQTTRWLGERGTTR